MSLSVINPYDQSVYYTLAFDTPAEMEAKVQGAKAAAENWREVSLAERIGTVRNALDYFRTHEAAIAESITGQMGKPITASHNEIAGLFERAGHMLSIADDTLAPEILPPKDHLHRRIEREPLGVVLNIAAWNYPLLIAANVVVPALVAGNSVLLKHSAKTPLCGEHFQAAFSHVPGLVTHLVLSHDQTLDLIRDARIDHVVFTGSVAGGRRIHQAAAAPLPGRTAPAGRSHRESAAAFQHRHRQAGSAAGGHPAGRPRRGTRPRLGLPHRLRAEARSRHPGRPHRRRAGEGGMEPRRRHRRRRRPWRRRRPARRPATTESKAELGRRQGGGGPGLGRIVDDVRVGLGGDHPHEHGLGGGRVDQRRGHDDLVAFEQPCTAAADQFQAFMLPQFLNSGQDQIAGFRDNCPAE